MHLCAATLLAPVSDPINPDLIHNKAVIAFFPVMCILVANLCKSRVDFQNPTSANNFHYLQGVDDLLLNSRLAETLEKKMVPRKLCLREV